MAKEVELIKGGLYRVKASTGWTTAEYMYSRDRGYQRQSMHHYFTNTKTGRVVELKSVANVKRCEAADLR